MNWINFISGYWAQIVLILGALGYLLKIILDHRFKRREIWYSISSQKKMECILKFQEYYYKAESETLGLLSMYKTGVVNIENDLVPDVLSIVITYRNAGQSLNLVKLFLKGSQFDILQKRYITLGKYLQSTAELLKHKNNNTSLTTDVAKLYAALLETINKGDKKLENFMK